MSETSAQLPEADQVKRSNGCSRSSARSPPIKIFRLKSFFENRSRFGPRLKRAEEGSGRCFGVFRDRTLTSSKMEKIVPGPPCLVPLNFFFSLASYFHHTCWFGNPRCCLVFESFIGRKDLNSFHTMALFHCCTVALNGTLGNVTMEAKKVIKIVFRFCIETIIIASNIFINHHIM